MNSHRAGWCALIIACHCEIVILGLPNLVSSQCRAGISAAKRLTSRLGNFRTKGM
jgi:hypothetical protein